ncbi:ATP-binding protein [Tautonia sociabilis]|uniref:ATP-binding protein n=1 Tax=Tautonia sociabilis TaxID=2080755 RepID=UPI0013158AB8|nr:ATP-binding protein [Tautonia sociabilis]
MQNAVLLPPDRGIRLEREAQRRVPGRRRGRLRADGPRGCEPVLPAGELPVLLGSTAISTNKSVKDWPGIFAGDEALAAGILDRLLHRSVVLNIRGRSYRLQDLERLLK